MRRAVHVYVTFETGTTDRNCSKAVLYGLLKTKVVWCVGDLVFQTYVTYMSGRLEDSLC
jgi:hypothetical protein